MDPRHDDIERYLSNRMTDAERHAFEKKALSDPFLADAIAGAQSIKEEQFASDVRALRDRIKVPAKTPAMAFRIAAGVLLTVAAGWLIWNPKVPTETDSASAETSGPVATDSIRPAMADSKAEEIRTSTKGEEKPAQAKHAPRPTPGEPEGTTKPASAAGVATSPEPAPLAEAAEEATVVESRKEANQVPYSKRSAAQAQVVVGKVTEAEDGIPLGNVVVKDADTQVETRTRGDGSYQLPVKTEKPTLQYSYPGLQSVELRAGQDIPADVRLTDDVERQSEVIAFPPERWSPSSTDDLQLATPTVGILPYQTYLEDNLVMPEPARNAGISGKVTVSMVIDATGHIQDLHAIKSLGYGCDEEAIRLVRSGPSWKPAVLRNTTVATTVWVKLEFRTKP